MSFILGSMALILSGTYTVANEDSRRRKLNKDTHTVHWPVLKRGTDKQKEDVILYKKNCNCTICTKNINLYLIAFSVQICISEYLKSEFLKTRSVVEYIVLAYLTLLTLYSYAYIDPKSIWLKCSLIVWGGQFTPCLFFTSLLVKSVVFLYF